MTSKRPPTIAELAETASRGLSWSSRYSLKTWLKSTYTLVTKAKECENEDLPHAFVLTARAATIILEKIPTHPDYASLDPAQKANLRTHGDSYLQALSRYKSTLNNIYSEWQLRNPTWTASDDQKGPPTSTTPEPRQLELRARRESVSRTVRFEGVEAGPSHSRGVEEVAAGLGRMNVSPYPPPHAPQPPQQQPYHEPRPPVIHWGAQPQQGWNGYGGYQQPYPGYTTPAQGYDTNSAANLVPHSRTRNISYPSIGPSHAQQQYTPTYPAPGGNGYDYTTSIPPPPRPRPPSFPALPLGGQEYYTPAAGATYRPIPYPVATPAPPPAPVQAKAVEYDSRTQGLRRLNIPTSVLPLFLTAAHANTMRKIETCGLLLGTSRSRPSAGEELFVEVLLIPRQTGTSDTCQMVDEEMVIDFQLERGLTVLSWIHSHPTQSCFMSSMDLHTHFPYQQSLGEAVAIVCAPRSDPSYGIFRLTEPGGLETIMSCKKSALFHQHPDIKGGIYTDADSGHVRLVKGAELEVVDLR